MAEQKKNIAKLAIQGISILGILLGLSCFLSVTAMILSIKRDTMTIVVSLIASVVGFVLGVYLIYNSYLMLRGMKFGLLKSIPTLLALVTFGLIIPFIEVLPKSNSGEISIFTKTIIDCAYFILLVLVSVLVYKISVKLIESSIRPSKNFRAPKFYR